MKTTRNYSTAACGAALLAFLISAPAFSADSTTTTPRGDSGTSSGTSSGTYGGTSSGTSGTTSGQMIDPSTTDAAGPCKNMTGQAMRDCQRAQKEKGMDSRNPNRSGTSERGDRMNPGSTGQTTSPDSSSQRTPSAGSERR